MGQDVCRQAMQEQAMKKVAKYDEEELEILQAWEAAALKPVSDMAKQTEAHRAAADATFKKDQRLNRTFGESAVGPGAHEV
jgi:hypothetical protein